jgi:hypothetical protein
MTEKVIGGQFDGLFGRDQQNVDGRSAVHAKVALRFVRFLEAVKPVN